MPFQKGHKLIGGGNSGNKHSEETKKKMSLASKGKPKSEEHRQKIRLVRLGKKASDETKKKMSESGKGKHSYWTGKRGNKSANWQGGKTSETRIIRGSKEYKLWRIAVFERDNYTCIWCGNNESGNLNADHIKPFTYYPELRFAIDNGRTLCVSCHKTTDTYGHKVFLIGKYI